MAQTTENFSFSLISEATLACTGLIEAFNSNMQKIDALPVPVQSGGNSALSYQRYADGTAHVFGSIDYGTAYPCYSPWASSAGYASDSITITLPIEMASTSYSFVRDVTANRNPDMWFVSSSKTLTSVTGHFLCAVDDSANPNSKQLDVDIWGRWE